MMRAASKGMPVKDFPAPSAKIRNGDLEPLPGVIGASITKAQQRLKDAGFDSYVAGNVASSLPYGTVAYTDPAGAAFPGVEDRRCTSRRRAGLPAAGTRRTTDHRAADGGKEHGPRRSRATGKG